MTRFLRRLHEERGSIAVFWVMGMMGLFGFLAVVADGGFVAAERRELQNAADAAALAGAQALPLDDLAAVADAQAWAEKNASGLTLNAVTLSDGQTRLTVTVGRNARGLFNGSLSLGRPEVQASATVRVATLALPGPGAAPLGLSADTYFQLGVQNGDPVTLVLVPPGSNSGLLRIDGQGANEMRNAMIYGSQSPLEPIENTETGQNVGPVLQGLQVRLQAALGAGCFYLEDVATSALLANWPCGPLQAGSAHPAGVQATSIVLIPIIVEDFAELEGMQEVLVYPTAGGLYLVAYFWIDALATFSDPLNGDWSCAGGPPASCELRGRFLFDMPSALASATAGDELIDYDPAGVVRVVQLID